MGSSLNKDSTLVIYLTLNKRVYYAGETLQGVVHIDCKANRPYTQLFLKVEGYENVHWEQNHNKVPIHYVNFRETYREELLLAQFGMGIQTGQYNFPFTILLPTTIPASFEFDTWYDNFIRYKISAIVPAYDSSSSPQIFQRSLHLREPCRLPQKVFSMRQMAQSQCWSCCCSCGSADLTLEADSVNLMQNEVFHARGLVDNSGGQTTIKSFKVVLREKVKLVSVYEYTDVTNKEFVLYTCPNSIQVGTSLPFNVELKVPLEVLGYTAIGNVIYRAYFLELVAEVNCCYSNPRISKHIILNNTIQPEVQKEELTQAPPGWNPRVANPVSFLNLKPYMYSPAGPIDVRNQLGVASNINSLNTGMNRGMEMEMNTALQANGIYGVEGRDMGLNMALHGQTANVLIA